MIDINNLDKCSESLLEQLRTARLKIATVESCTGGLVAGALTAIPGSSDVFERGWVTYSNTAKNEQVGVAMALIEAHGAVSAEVASAMAEGALRHSPADLAVSVTGIAGPGGGSESKPVGLVWFGCARRGQAVITRHEIFSGDRSGIRRAAVAVALQLLQQRI